MRATEQIQQTPEVRPDRRQTTRFARQRSQLVVLYAAPGLPLLKTPEGAIFVSEWTGTRGVSD